MKHNMKNSVIVDTGFFLALAQPRDQFHAKAKEVAQKHSHKEWFTTWPVLAELSYMLPRHCLIKLLHDQRKGLFEIFSIQTSHVPRLLELLEKYTDHEIDLADISLVLLAEHLNHGNILSCDRKDFSFLKWKNRSSFRNLFV